MRAAGLLRAPERCGLRLDSHEAPPFQGTVSLDDTQPSDARNASTNAAWPPEKRWLRASDRVEAPRGRVGAEAALGVGGGEIAVVRGLDDGAGHGQLGNGAVGLERKSLRVGRRGTVVVIVLIAVHREVLAVGEPPRHDADEAITQLGLAADQDREGGAARPAGQHDVRGGRQPQALLGSVDHHAVLARQLSGVQRSRRAAARCAETCAR